MTTDAPLPAYKPEVAMAFARSNDRLIAMILQGITDSESRSIEGSLYVLLLACVRRFNTSLARQTQFRDMFNLIKGQAIGSVKAFVAALPEDVRLDAVNDESTKSVIEMAKMITAVEKILAQVPKQDTGNVGFYTRLKTEIEQGKIMNFGELCERLPSFIVDHNEEMRQARHGFRNARDAKTTAITEFKNRAQAEIKLDIATTASGTSPNIYLRVLRTMIDDFATDSAWFDAWFTLRDSSRLQRYTVDNFLAGVPEPLRSKANQHIANIIRQ